jgi:hypothetical protein
MAEEEEEDEEGKLESLPFVCLKCSVIGGGPATA